MPAIINPGISVAVSLKTPNAVGGVTVSVSGNVATVTLAIDPAGVYVVRAWLADDVNGTLTLQAPNVSGVREWDVITNSSGQYVFTIEESGAKTWYFCWAVIAYLNVRTTALEFT